MLPTRLRILHGRLSISCTYLRAESYVSRSAHYPHRMMYDDKFIKGYLSVAPDGKLKMRHPVIRCCFINVNNSSLKHLESYLIVKLRPLGDWLVKPKPGESNERLLTVRESIEAKKWLGSEEISKKLRLDSVPPTLVMSRYYIGGYSLTEPVADIHCIAKSMFSRSFHQRYRWIRIERFNAYGDDITCINTNFSPLQRVDKEIERLYEINGPQAIYLGGQDKLLRRGDIRPTSHLEIDVKNILNEFGVIDEPFSDVAMKSLKNAHEETEREIPKRRDFRHMCVFSVDPPTAKDIDDALHVRVVGRKLYEVGIHIADVSQYVKYKSPLCEEAKRRGNTFYLEDRAIHMLPSELSEKLCSLRPGTPKLTMSVVCNVNQKGEVVGEPWIGPGVISSCAKLSYKQCDDILDGRDPYPELEISPNYFSPTVIENVKSLHKLAVEMRKRRLAAGALTIEDEKVEIKFNSADDLPLTFLSKARGKSSKLIEEFMLLANTTVAAYLMKHLPKTAFFRRHPPPSMNKLTDLKAVFEDVGVEFQGAESKSLQRSMEDLLMKVTELEDDCGQLDYERVLSYMLIRSMNSAEYTIPQQTEKWLRHYGLSVPLYTHFTSPIRRFSDVVVHYQLKAIMGVDGFSDLDLSFLRSSANICNEKRYKSRTLALRLHEYYMWNLVESLQKTRLFFAVYVTRITQDGISFYCPSSGYAGSINLKAQKGVTAYAFDEKSRTANVVFERHQCGHFKHIRFTTLARVVCRFKKLSNKRLKTILVPPSCQICEQKSFFKSAKDDVVAASDRSSVTSSTELTPDSASEPNPVTDAKVEDKKVCTIM